MKKNKVVTIVGLGVIGGSYAIALRKLGYDVYAVDIDEKSLNLAIDCGAILEGETTPDNFFPISDLIVFALYPSQIVDYLKNTIHIIKEGTILTDVSGIKSHYIHDIDEIIKDKVDFVFCHPMAGREKKVFEYAAAEVFQNANFIVVKNDKNKPENVEEIKTIAKEMGFASIKELSVKEHDKIISYTSQLPHALAVALINSDVFENTNDYIGDSYRDLTRIANINEKLWSELFLGNKDNLLNAIENFEEQLDIIKKAVKNSDKETLEKCFVESTARKEKLVKKPKEVIEDNSRSAIENPDVGLKWIEPVCVTCKHNLGKECAVFKCHRLLAPVDIFNCPSFEKE